MAIPSGNSRSWSSDRRPRASARHRLLGAIQDRSALVWARASGGCRLDHDVLRSVHEAGLTMVEQRTRAGGLLIEIVAA